MTFSNKNSDSKTDLKANEKVELRATLKAKTAEYLRANKNCETKLIEFLKKILPQSGCIGVFKPLADEPNIQGLSQGTGCKLVYPRVEGEVLAFYQSLNSSDFTKSTLGVEEPDPDRSQKIELSDLSAILVPGIGFDQNCRRLGRGKGFYDRTLKDFAGLKIGIATVAHMVPALPFEEHDVTMDIVVTDEFVLKKFDT